MCAASRDFSQLNLELRDLLEFVGEYPTQESKTQEKKVIDKRRKGVVANYNDNGFGFLAVVYEENRKRYNTNMFFHNSAMSMERLKKGDFVQFDVAIGRKGFEAINLNLAEDEAEKMKEGEDENKESDNRVGEVIRFNSKKRFGIVRCQKTGMTILAHCSKLKPPLEELVVGQIVTFKMTTGPRESIASDIEVITDVSESPSPIEVPCSQEKSHMVSKPSKPKCRSSATKSNSKQNKSIPRTAIKKDDDLSFKKEVSSELTCNMCLDLLSEDSLATPCEHNFCRDCIEPWIKRKPICPVCKGDVQKDDLKPVPRVIRNLIKTASA